MVLQQEDPPLLARLFPTRRLPGAPVFEYRLRLAAAIDERPRIAGVQQHLVDAMPTRQAPLDLPSRRPGVHLGQPQLRLTVPQRGLTRTAQFTKLREDP